MFKDQRFDSAMGRLWEGWRKRENCKTKFMAKTVRSIFIVFTAAKVIRLVEDVSQIICTHTVLEMNEKMLLMYSMQALPRVFNFDIFKKYTDITITDSRLS